MNAQNTKFASAVIPRMFSGEVCFFFADEEPKDTVRALVGTTVQDVPLDVYKNSLPLSSNDVKVSLEIYKKRTGVASPVARSRMPYRKDLKGIPDRLQITNETIEKAPEEQKPLLQAVQVQQKKRGPVPGAKRAQALARAATDSVSAAITSLKAEGKNITEEQLQQATKELSDKIAQMILTTLTK